MGLRLKFNLVLILVFALGLVASGYVSKRILEANAQEEVTRNAELMMGAALAVRGYTYKEATLNPTNPRDRAVEWEADIVQQFRNDPAQGEIRGTRDTPTGRALYLAKPLKISDPGCLPCHDTPDTAPKSMVAHYGNANGFGWKLGETVGAQIISVPMSVPLAKADQAFRTFMTSLVGVFLLAFIVLNVVLSLLVIRPIVRMSRAADEVSTGNFDVPEFSVGNRDEIGVLATSFNRLRRSLEKAMKLLE